MGNYANARQIFERWMEWEPDPNAWNVYIKFEIRCGEIDVRKREGGRERGRNKRRRGRSEE